jgi:formamidopyrimidine-DNA glycosylase
MPEFLEVRTFRDRLRKFIKDYPTLVVSRELSRVELRKKGLLQSHTAALICKWLKSKALVDVAQRNKHLAIRFVDRHTNKSAILFVHCMRVSLQTIDVNILEKSTRLQRISLRICVFATERSFRGDSDHGVKYLPVQQQGEAELCYLL